MKMLVTSFFYVQDELCGIEPRRRMRYENPSEARLLREAYARTTRRPHTETFAEKVVRDLSSFFFILNPTLLFKLLK